MAYAYYSILCCGCLCDTRKKKWVLFWVFSGLVKVIKFVHIAPLYLVHYLQIRIHGFQCLMARPLHYHIYRDIECNGVYHKSLACHMACHKLPFLHGLGDALVAPVIGVLDRRCETKLAADGSQVVGVGVAVQPLEHSALGVRIVLCLVENPERDLLSSTMSGSVVFLVMNSTLPFLMLFQVSA